MNSRLINILVDGSHLTKDRGTAGVQYEGNSTVLRIKFDESWDNLAKSVTWWNAKGLNPVVRVLTVDMLEDIKTSTRVYRCPIPAEPLTEAGMCTFVIDGFQDGKRQRSISDQLKVTPAPYAANAGATADPTPTQAEQLQAQIDTLMQYIREEVVKAVTSAQDADNSRAAAERAVGNAIAIIGGDYASASYVDEKIASIPTPDVSGQINTHNASPDAHSDIRDAIFTRVPKSGGTMTGNLTVEKSGIRHIFSVNTSSNVAYQQYNDTTRNVAANIGLSDSQLYYQVTKDMSTWTKYPILHTGNKNQIFTYGTDDLVDGVSALETGKLYFVYK